MKRLLASTALILSLTLAGCGGKDLGPANPDETPQVSEEEVQKAMTENMPDEAKKMYEQYQKGGGPNR